MKIIKIAFKNINSLKGEHEVDFSQAPLHNAGIFAITGPTGSGKSTLLDVITLALFNRVPRFKKSISKNEITTLGSIMTHHTSEARASITYDVNGLPYTSTWEIAKARTGNLRDYHMEIIDPYGKVLDLKKSEVPEKNESIIGLKYDQFVKSIILAQGEFSKFLQADKNERGELLENITGATVYRTIGKAAYERFKQGKEEVEQKRIILDELEALSDEERNAIIEEIKKADKEKKGLEKDIKDSEALRTIKVDVKTLTKNIEEKNIQLKNKITELKSFEPQLRKLALHEKISPLRGDVSLYKNEQKNVAQLFEQLTQLEKEHIARQKMLNNVVDDAQKLSKSTVNLDSFRAIVTAFEHQVNKMDDDLDRIKKDGIAKRQQLSTLIPEGTPKLTNKTKPEDALHHLHREAQDLERSMSAAGLTIDSRVDSLTAELKTHRDLHTGLKELRQLSERISQLDKDIQTKQKNLNHQADTLTKTQPLLSKSTALVRTLKSEAELLQQQKEDAIKIAELTDHRHQLQDGKPCPLCGSTAHPYAIHLPADRTSDLEQKIKANNKRLLEESNEERQLEAKIAATKNSITHLENDLKELRATHQRTTLEREHLLQQHNGSLPSEVEQLDKNIEALNTKINLLENGIHALVKIKTNHTLAKEYNELATILEKYKKLEVKRMSVTKEKDISKVCGDLQERFDKHLAEKNKIEHSIASDQKNHNQAKENVSKLEDQLHPFAQKHGFDSIMDLDAHLLSEEEKTKIQEKDQKLTHDKTTLAAEIQALSNTLKEKIDKDLHPELTLDILDRTIHEKKEKFNALSTGIGKETNRLEQDDTTRKKIKNKTTELNKLTKKLEKWSLLNNLIGDKTGNKFSNFAQGLTLQHLLALANNRLIRLSDRYLLDKPDHGDTLKIVDKYQGNTERAVSTLSGGETFLISLALALSLSDMASKNVPLDSLFIDEGFGTLDQETLDMAMDTLERLQSDSQKTVGVISHVEALKERIEVQIKLNKNAQGYSRVEVGHFGFAQ